MDAKTTSLLRERFAHFGARWMAAFEQGKVGRELQSLTEDFAALRDSHARTVADHEETVASTKSLDEELKELHDAHARTIADHEETVAWAKSLEGDLSQARAALNSHDGRTRSGDTTD